VSATLGLDAARACDPAQYAIGGRFPRLAIRPQSREELCEVLRAATADDLGVVPWGGGVALSRDQAPLRFDVALDLRGLSRIVEYQPDDLTLTAECGAGIESLRSTLAAKHQELPLEAAEGWAATLGWPRTPAARGARCWAHRATGFSARTSRSATARWRRAVVAWSRTWRAMGFTGCCADRAARWR
jgi:hypothetical protein